MNFSENDLYRANTTNLVSYLESHGQRIKRVGSTYQYIYTDGSGTHDNVTISGGKWYDHKNQRGGYAVKFLQEYLGFSFQDSVIELLGGHCDAQTVRSAPREAPKPVIKPFELPKPNSDMSTVQDPEDGISRMIIAGKAYTDKESAGQALANAMKTVKSTTDRYNIGSYKGFQLYLSYSSFSQQFTVDLQREGIHSITLGDS